MKTSKAGVLKITGREGCRTTAYKDSVGVWTIGVGHTGRASGPPVKAGMKITNVEAMELLQEDLVPFENSINRLVHRPLTQHQFDALVSFVFNIGETNFHKSSVLREINEGNMLEAADAFLAWTKPPELRPRRYSERAQFLSAV